MTMLAEKAKPQFNVGVSHVPGEALVKVRKGMSDTLAPKLSILNLNIHKKMNLLAGDFLVIQSSTKSIFSLIEILTDLPEVEYAEPNYTNRTSLPQRETALAQADYNQNPWEKFVVKEAAIELIDTKIDLKFPQVKPDVQVNRKKLHAVRSGEHIDEINIKELLFLSDKIPVSLADAVEAIDYATKREVNIVSNTWVKDGFSKALDEAINVADKKGISFVAAASIAATIGTSMAALGYNPSPHYKMNNEHTEFLSSLAERKPVSHVSAGMLSLYIAQEGNVERTGRGRLIVKNVPSPKELRNVWNSNAPGLTTHHESDETDIKISQDYSFPGAKFIKLEIEKLNSSTNIDLIVLRNANGVIINNISGSGTSYETDYIETNLVTVEFTSNATSTSIGSVIRNVKVIY